MINQDIINNLINNFDASQWTKFTGHFVKVLEDEEELVIITRTKNDRPPIFTIERYNKNPKPLPSDTSTLKVERYGQA